MNKLKFLLVSILLVTCNTSKKENQLEKENEILKQTAKQKEKVEITMQNINGFIPTGYEIVESGNDLNKVMSDLNDNGISDYVVLLASGNNNKDYSNSKNVRLAIFEGQNNDSFKLRSQTGNLTSSFLHTNSNKRIKVVNKNVIKLKHQSMRHDYESKFRYESTYKNYMRIGSEYNNYGNAMQDGAGNISSNFVAGKRISTINRKKITKVDTELKPISAIDDSNIYELISQ